MTRTSQAIDIAAVTIASMIGTSPSLATCPNPPSGHDCKCNGDDSAWVCAKWSNEAFDPVEGSDFAVDFSGDDPGVELRTGDSDWEIFAEDTATHSPIDIGVVTLDPSAAAADFGVSIKKSSAAGAVNVGAVSLIDSDTGSGPTWTGGSNLNSLIATGDVSGAITVVKDSGGQEGNVGSIDVAGDLGSSVTIPGNVTGSIDVDGTISGYVVIGSYGVSGDVTGPLTVGEIAAPVLIYGDYGSTGAQNDINIGLIDNNMAVNLFGSLLTDDSLAVNVSQIGNESSGTGGSVILHSSVTNSNVTVTIGDLARVSGKNCNVSFNANFGGTLKLNNGVPDYQEGSGQTLENTVQVTGLLLSTAVVNLMDKTVEGNLNFGGAQSGAQVINGGTLRGSFYPSQGDGDFAGTARFYNVEAGGQIYALCPGTPLAKISGVIKVCDNDDCNGTCEGTGCGELAGLFRVDGPFTGQLIIEEDLAAHSGNDGLIWLVKDASPTITIKNDMIGHIHMFEDFADDGLVTVGGNMTSGSVLKVEGGLMDYSEVQVDGLCDGLIDIGTETGSTTQITLADGLDDNGQILINTSEGEYSAAGDILVGTTGLSSEPIVFDGCIHLFDESGSGDAGDLDGDIGVIGCYDKSNPLGICVDGDVNGSIYLQQAAWCTVPDPALSCLNCE